MGVILRLYWGYLGMMEKNMEIIILSQKGIEYGVYGNLIIRYPKPYSIYLRGTIDLRLEVSKEQEHWQKD